MVRLHQGQHNMVKIEFGTLFSVRGYPGRIDVVTDPGERGKTFGTNVVFLNKNQERELKMGCGGTAGTENIDKIVGKMTLEELEQAVRRGYEMPEAVEGRIELLRRHSKMSARNV